MSDEKRELFWVHCPKCGGKTRLKIYENTVLLNFPLYCPSCKRELEVSVIQLKMVILNEPDA